MNLLFWGYVCGFITMWVDRLSVVYVGRQNVCAPLYLLCVGRLSRSLVLYDCNVVHILLRCMAMDFFVRVQIHACMHGAVLYSKCCQCTVFYGE